MSFENDEKQRILEAYDDVRCDTSPTNWLLCKYDKDKIVLTESGECYDDLSTRINDDERAYIFVRVMMGDEMSKRSKFALITWCGDEVTGIKRAKMSTDKSVIKSVIKNYAVDVQATVKSEMELDVVKDLLKKAGGANYGTGVRD